jgi:hypothetical protein
MVTHSNVRRVMHRTYSMARSMIRSMMIALAVLLALVFAGPALAATATVDRDSIGLDETVTLTLSVDSASIFGEPDLSKLEDDFHVLNTSRRTQIVNGDASTQWIIPLSPKHEGKLRIPPLDISGERSPPIFINVTAKSAAAGDTTQSLWMSVETEKPSVYVQEQAIVTVRIGTAIDLMEAPSVQKPDIPNVVFEVLNSTQYTKRIDGTRYTVFEIKCAFFPDRSGALVIPPFVAQVTVPQQTQQNSSLFFQRFLNQGRRLQLKSKPVDLDVKEKPKDFPANAVWLPAQSLTATETWSDDPQNVATGGSITRTVTLQARGSLGEQLPTLPTYRLDGFKLYPDQAKTDKQLDTDSVNGSRIESIAMLPTRPGEFQLPEIRVPWWNTKTDKLDYAVLPAIALKVHGAALTTPAAPAPNANSVPAPDIKSPTATSPAAIAGALKPQPAAAYWPWICAALAGAWILTLLLWWQSRRRQNQAELEADNDFDIKAQEKAAWDALTAALKMRASKTTASSQDLRQIRNALLALAAIWFPQRRHVGLDALGIGNESLSKQLQLLDRQLYAPDAQASERLDTNLLLDELRQLRSSRKQNSNVRDDLPPLYPQASPQR